VFEPHELRNGSDFQNMRQDHLMDIECNQVICIEYDLNKTRSFLPSLFQTDDKVEKLFIVDLNPSILVCVKSSERLRQTLKLDAQLDEVVEEDAALRLSVILLQEKPHSLVVNSRIRRMISYVRNFPCQTQKISKVSLVVMGS
jgi:hypothetical protein